MESYQFKKILNDNGRKLIIFTLISKKNLCLILQRMINFKIEIFQPSHRANARRVDESICSVFCQMRRKRNAR